MVFQKISFLQCILLGYELYACLCKTDFLLLVQAAYSHLEGFFAHPKKRINRIGLAFVVVG